MNKSHSEPQLDINYMLSPMIGSDQASKKTNSSRRISKVTGLEMDDVDDDFQSLMTSLDTRQLGINIALDSTNSLHSSNLNTSTESYGEEYIDPPKQATPVSEPNLSLLMASSTESSPASNPTSTPISLTSNDDQKLSLKWAMGKSVSSDAFDFVPSTSTHPPAQAKETVRPASKEVPVVQLGRFPPPVSQGQTQSYSHAPSHQQHHQNYQQQQQQYYYNNPDPMMQNAGYYPQAMGMMGMQQQPPQQGIDTRFMYPYPNNGNNGPIFPKPQGIQTSQSDSILYANNAILTGFSPEILSNEYLMQYGNLNFAPPYVPWNVPNLPPVSRQAFHDDKRFPQHMQYNGYGNSPQVRPPLVQPQQHQGRNMQQQQAQVQHQGDQGGLAQSSFPIEATGIRGQVIHMSQDRVGCRQLQQLLDTGNMGVDDEDSDNIMVSVRQLSIEETEAQETRKREAFAIVLEETRPSMHVVMMDVFGNYLFQKIIEKISGEERYQAFISVGSYIIDAAKDLHGTRSVQRIIELCETQSQIELIYSIIRPSIIDLCIDPNGNHVIQRVLQCWKHPANGFVYEAVVRSCAQVSCHRHGCCVIQRCLDFAVPSQQQTLIQEIVRLAVVLMQDPYGNYVVQYVLDQYDEQNRTGERGGISQDQCRNICEAPLGMVAGLSIQKFSSNVIEKCFEKAPEDVQASYIQEMTASPALIRTMIEDQYANYVLQKAVIVCSTTNAMSLIRAIRPHSNILKNTSGGRRIAVKLAKRFPQGLMATQQMSQYQQEQEEANRPPPLPSPFTVPKHSPSTSSASSYDATFPSPINYIDSNSSSGRGQQQQRSQGDRFFNESSNNQTQPMSSSKAEKGQKKRK